MNIKKCLSCHHLSFQVVVVNGISEPSNSKEKDIWTFDGQFGLLGSNLATKSHHALEGSNQQKQLQFMAGQRTPP